MQLLDEVVESNNAGQNLTRNCFVYLNAARVLHNQSTVRFFKILYSADIIFFFALYSSAFLDNMPLLLDIISCLTPHWLNHLRKLYAPKLETLPLLFFSRVDIVGWITARVWHPTIFQDFVFL